jgi:glycosyltransferase involved in cell wall biosynthesis
MKPLVTVITPTTGSEQLKDAVLSVENQTYENIQYLIVIDGKEREEKTRNVLDSLNCQRYDLITLPQVTGYQQYNGHRIYGAMTYIAEGEYLCFLDQDNWYEPNHIESLINIAHEKMWAYSLRKIVDQSGNFICNDDCESLGKWKSVLGDNFVDVGCYMIPKGIALRFSPGWYRRARHPEEQPEVDRLLSHLLFKQVPQEQVDTNGQYTLNYRVASRGDSVQATFFLNGNEQMKNSMNGEYPWRKI